MRRALLPAFALLLVSCGLAGGGDKSDADQGTGTPGNWTMALSFNRPSITVQHGQTDTTTMTVTRAGGFTGPVRFVVNAPDGIAAQVTNIVTTGTVTTALLSLTPGTGSDIVYSIPFPVGVEATGADVFTSQQLTVNVTRKNGFWTTAPAAVSVARGSASNPMRVTFTKTGFTDDVTMSLPLFNGAPAGITGTFTPNPISGDTVTSVTILVDASVPEGTYSIGVRCNGGGYQGTAPVTLTVTAAAGLSMSFVTNPLVVAKGGQAGTLINLGRTNLTAGITPTVTSTLPTGVSVTFGPPTSFGPTISMNVVTTLAATPGSYTINVTSGGVGVPVVTIPLTLTITP